MVIPGYDCGGDEIKVQFADRTRVLSYTARDLSACETICNIHFDCTGFVHDTDVNYCGYFRGSPPPIHPFIWTSPTIRNRNCHKKTSGNFPFYIIKPFNVKNGSNTLFHQTYY